MKSNLNKKINKPLIQQILQLNKVLTSRLSLKLYLASQENQNNNKQYNSEPVIMATSIPSTDLVTQLLELEKEAMKKFKQVDKKYEMNGLQKVIKLTITVCDGPANYNDDKQMKPTLSRRKIKQRKRRDDFRQKKRSEARGSSLTLKAQSSICNGNSTGILPKETQSDYPCDSKKIMELIERRRPREKKTILPIKLKNYPQTHSYRPKTSHEYYCETCEKRGIFNGFSWLNRYRWYNKPHFHHQYLKDNSKEENVSFYDPEDEYCGDCLTSGLSNGYRFHDGWNSISHFHHYKPPDEPAQDSDHHLKESDKPNHHVEDPDYYKYM